MSTNPSALDQLWHDLTTPQRSYLEGGYFQPQADPLLPHLPPALRLEYVSRSMIEPMAEQMFGLNKAQARRFFSHVRLVESQLRSRRVSWPQARVSLQQMESHVMKKSANNKLPPSFQEFICRNLKALPENDGKREFLEGFVPHFEALINFGSLHWAADDRS